MLDKEVSAVSEFVLMLRNDIKSSAQLFWWNVEESCTFQKINGAGKFRFQTKWSGWLEEKAQI